MPWREGTCDKEPRPRDIDLSIDETLESIFL